MVNLIAAIPNPGGPASPGAERWLRIHGDEANGFSLTAHMAPLEPPLYDLWFSTLDEAYQAGSDYEIERDDWQPQDSK